MATLPFSVVSKPALRGILSRSADRQSLSSLFDVVTLPNLRTHVAETAAAILNEAMAGGAILADPSVAAGTDKGAIEIAIDALHDLPATDDDLLETAFAKMPGDLADLPDGILQHQILPPPGLWLRSPAAFLNTWLRSTEAASGSWLFRFDMDMGIDRARLADQLVRIEDDEEARSLVHGGHLRQALLLGRPFGDLTQDESDDLIRGFARVLAVVIAHFRVALLRRWARKPMTESVRFDHEWQTMARCMMSGVVAPATAILPILTLPEGPACLAELPDFLQRTPLRDPAFLSLIEEIAGKCPRIGNGKHGFDQHVARLQAEMARLTRDVATIREKDLVADGWGRMSFVEDRIGLSASRGSVLAAWSMLSSPAEIDACFAAAKAGRPCPSPRQPVFKLDEKAIGLLKLLRATDHLRREIMPDRESSKMRARAGFKNHAGIALVRKAVHDFERRHPSRAMDMLRIDPRAWFA